MYKKFTALKCGNTTCHTFKFLLIMKLTTIILLVTFLQVNAASYAQEVSIKGKDMSIQHVFNQLTKQTGYNFICDADLIKEMKLITISENKMQLKEVLAKCFENKQVDIIFNNSNTVVIKEKSAVKNQIVENVIIAVTGSVVDNTGQTLPGVSVVEKGTTNGSTTNAKGEYTIKVTGPNSILVFSFLGFDSQEIKIGAKTTIDVRLIPKIDALNEVVVVGYGTQKKVTLTGAVSAISGEQLTTTRNESVTNMLTGKLPGVRVVQKSAEPGVFNSSFDIRGLGSPLIIIDGVPRGGYERLDPNDIESISVLKDATAAVYGVQSANGVVLITTKKGKAGTSELRYEVTTGVQRSSGMPAVAGAVDWMTLRNEQAFRVLDGPLVPTYSATDIADYASGKKRSTDWYPSVLLRNAPETQHSLTATGGSDKATYYLSLGYFNQGGFWKSGDFNYKKYNFRSNVTAKIAKGLNATLQVSGISDVKNMPYGVSGQNFEVFKSLWRIAPILPMFINDDPTLPAYAVDTFNPIAITTSDMSGYIKNARTIFQGNFSVDYDIPFVKGLKAKGLFSYDADISDNKQYIKTYTVFNQLSATNIVPVVNNSPASVTRSYANYPNRMLQFSLDYNHTFGNHTVGALALYEERTQTGDNFSAYRQLAISTLDQLGTGNALNQVANQNVGSLINYATKSVVEKLHYDFRSKYLIDFTGRFDGSSRFSGKKQWGFFPSVAAAWRVSEESFIKNTPALSFIDNLKFRVSYGTLGDASGLAFQFLTGYNFPASGRVGGSGNDGHAYGNGNGTVSPGYVFDGNFITGVGYRSLANTDITWYQSKTLNIGIDADLWKGLLGFQVDWFRRDRSGLLATRLLSLPGSLGASLPQENLNSDRTEGVELVLTHANRLGKFGYNISGNVSYTRNQARYSDRAPSGSQYDNWLNNPVNRYSQILRSNDFAGRYQSFDQIFNSRIDNGNGNRAVLPGDYYYQDWNGDGYANADDNHPIYPSSGDVPLVNFGMNIGVNYKGFDLDALFQGVAARKILYGDILSLPFVFANSNTLQAFTDRWHPVDPAADPYNPNTKYVEGYYPYTGGAFAKYQNAAYLRLKTLTLGYTLPPSLLRKVGVKKARVYVNGYDLFTITGIKIVDPEHPADDNSYIYPLNKTYNIGMSISF